MWAEIIIRTDKQFPANLKSTFESVFGISANVAQGLNNTVFAGSEDFIDKIIYVFKSNDKVFLIFNDDIYTLRIHIESIISKDKFELLDKAVNDTFKSIENYITKNKLKIKIATASIYAESSFIIKGEYTTKFKVFTGLLKKDIPLKVYIPVVTLLVSYLMNRDFEKSFYNAIIALSATLVWLIIETLRSNTEIKYALNK